MNEPTKNDMLWFLRSGWNQATVVQPYRSPWQQARSMPVHVARTVVFYSPAIVRAADAKPRRR